MRFLALVALALALPAAASEPATSLPGVSDEETSIPGGGVGQILQGHGDVIFVRDRTNHWYRVALNNGCLRGLVKVDSAQFETATPMGRIETADTVRILKSVPRNCRIESIRASAPPPQIDSDSVVTLD